MKFKGLGHLFLLHLLVIFFFQNCFDKSLQNSQSPTNEKANIAIGSDQLALQSGNDGGSGNGGGYDGKLTFEVSYKNKLFYDGYVKMFSGETMSFVVSGGEAPYTYSVDGTGEFDELTLSYTTSYFEAPKIIEHIYVTDSRGTKGTITIEIHSFFGQSKLYYPERNSQTPVIGTGGNLVLDSNGNLFHILTSQTWKQESRSTLFFSSDGGENWTKLREFQFHAKLFLNPFSDELFIVKSFSSEIFKSSNKGNSWQRMPKVAPKSKKLVTNVMSFLGPKTFILSGSMASAKAKNQASQWATLISETSGITWNLVDRYNSEVEFQASEGHQINFNKKNKEILVSILAKSHDASDCSWIIRKSTDLGKSWVFDQMNCREQNGNRVSRINSLLADKNGNSYFVATSFTGYKNAKVLVYKKSAASNEWENTSEIKNIDRAEIYEVSGDKLLLVGHLAKVGIDKTILYQSLDFGKTWEIVFDFSKAKFQVGSRLVEMSDGTLRTIGIRINEKLENEAVFYKSNHLGESWSVQSTKKLTNSSGGDFKAVEFLEYDKNTFFISGYSLSNRVSSGFAWLVLKSSDAGETWSKSDIYYGENSLDISAKPFSLSKDSSGNIYVAGKITSKIKKGTNIHYDSWIVRKSSDLGITWRTVDKLKPAQISKITEIEDDSKNVSTKDYSALTKLRNTRDFKKFGFAAGFLEIVDANTILTLGTRVSSDNEVNSVVTKSIIRKSDDGGETWNSIDEFGVNSVPLAIKACFSDHIFVLSRDAEQNILRRSTDKGMSWTNIQVPGFNQLQRSLSLELRSVEIVAKEISCQGDKKVSFFANKKSTENKSKNEVVYFYSDDKGLNWKSQSIDFEKSSISDFAISSVASENDYFWLAGSIYSDSNNTKTFGDTDWAVIRINADLKNDFIVDQEENSLIRSNINKIRVCEFGFCVIGFTQDHRFSESFTTFKSIERK